MSRGVRLLVMFLVMMGVIMLMMECAKKSMHKNKAHPADGGSSQGWLQPGRVDAGSSIAYAQHHLPGSP